jgi:hypothetical protein
MIDLCVKRIICSTVLGARKIGGLERVLVAVAIEQQLRILGQLVVGGRRILRASLVAGTCGPALQVPAVPGGALMAAATVSTAPALHYLDGRNGVKDFDVWSFYAARVDDPFSCRWRGTAAVLRDYLSTARTASAKALAGKAVIMLTPEHRASELILPK